MRDFSLKDCLSCELLSYKSDKKIFSCTEFHCTYDMTLLNAFRNAMFQKPLALKHGKLFLSLKKKKKTKMVLQKKAFKASVSEVSF